MKRILTVITAAVLVLALLAACGAKNVDLSAVTQSITSSYDLGEMKTVDDTDALNRYYQISPDDVKQFSALLSSSAKAYNEIVIVEAVDSTAAENVKTQLDARLSSQLSNAKSYDAEQVSMIEACKVKTSGSFVYMVIGADHDAIVSDIEAALK